MYVYTNVCIFHTYEWMVITITVKLKKNPKSQSLLSFRQKEEHAQYINDNSYGERFSIIFPCLIRVIFTQEHAAAN